MSDYIKREDAITVIYDQHVGGKEACENARSNTFGADLREIVSDIEDIPSADVVDRKTGKWRENGEPNAYGKFELWYYVCSLCGAVGIQEYNYCPNCGARMVSE